MAAAQRRSYLQLCELRHSSSDKHPTQFLQFLWQGRGLPRPLAFFTSTRNRETRVPFQHNNDQENKRIMRDVFRETPFSHLPPKTCFESIRQGTDPFHHLPKTSTRARASEQSLPGRTTKQAAVTPPGLAATTTCNTPVPRHPGQPRMHAKVAWRCLNTTNTRPARGAYRERYVHRKSHQAARQREGCRRFPSHFASTTTTRRRKRPLLRCGQVDRRTTARGTL